MPVQTLIVAQPVTPARLGKNNVGQITSVRSLAELLIHPWGGREAFPDFVKITIADADVTDIHPWMVPKTNEFTYELQLTNPTQTRWRISVPTTLQQQFGQEAFSQGFVDFMISEFGASVVGQPNFTSGFARFDVPDMDFDLMKATIKDGFESQMDIRRFRLNDAFVNQANAANGFIDKTLVEFNGAMLDTIA